MNDNRNLDRIGRDSSSPTPLYDTKGVLQAWRDPYSNQICSLNRPFRDCYVEPSGLVINAYGHAIARISPTDTLLLLSSSKLFST